MVKKVHFYFMAIGSFIVSLKTHNIYIWTQDVETIFDTSIYELNGPLLKGKKKKKKVISVMKDGFG